MSEILARIRVRETHGIRRFLYPLSIIVDMPEGTDTSQLGWSGTRGDSIPLQIACLSNKTYRLDFAVSLAPMEERTLEVVKGGFQFPTPDPLEISTILDDGLHSHQERVSYDIMPDGNISQVRYDGIPHLSGPSSARTTIYAGSAIPSVETTQIEDGPLKTSLTIQGTYTLSYMSREGQTTTSGKMPFESVTEITACKSWIKRTHRFTEPEHSGWIIFYLNLIASKTPLLCDFGVGGCIYSKLTTNNGIVLCLGEAKDNIREWTIFSTDKDGRQVKEEYRGRTSQNWHSELWFHVIDSDKALAVAITQVPDAYEINIRLTAEGHTSIECLGHNNEPVEFGVCYHFLNDVPAIAAATNPQSILLPPVVEVLPG